MLRICELLASSVFQKIGISHLCDALTTVHPFGSQEVKMTYTTANEALKPLFIKLNCFEIGRAVIEKSRRKHDPKLTLLCSENAFLLGVSLEKLSWAL